MSTEKTTFLTSPAHRGERIMLSFIFQGIGLFIMLALISCVKNITGISTAMLQKIISNDQLVANDLGVLGATLSNMLIVDLFGISAFSIPILFLITGAKLFFPKKVGFSKSIFMTLFLLVWSSIAIDYYFPNPTTIQWYSITGQMMHRLAASLTNLIGAGVILFLALGFFAFVLVLFAGASSKYNEVDQTIVEPIIRNGLIPPYKVNRANYYQGGPHAELTGAYFTTQNSYTTSHATSVERGTRFHAEAARFSMKKEENNPASTTNYVEESTTYQPELNTPYLKPNLYIESDARHSGYKTANLIFANHNHDHRK